jgi:hypothetical protein
LQLGARLPELPVHSPEAVEQELATSIFCKSSSNQQSGGWSRL